MTLILIAVFTPNLSSAFFEGAYISTTSYFVTVVKEVQAEEPPIIAPPAPKIAPRCPYKNKDFNPCSCFSFLKFKLGIPQDKVLGDAWKLVPTSKVPKVGSIVLTKEGIGHAGYVINYTDETITLEEYNFVYGQKSVRTLQRTDPRIRGYLVYKSPVLVYNR